MTESRHRSIGEVLSLLKGEHTDITISKIRFFESQGLIDPERTPSGYRKFYDADIDRLRWILTQQRDNYLPLKVIKRRMDEAGFDPVADAPSPDSALPEPSLFAKREAAAATEAAPASAPGPEPRGKPETGPMSRPKPEPKPQPKGLAEPAPVADASPIADGDPLSTDAASVSMSADELAEAAGVNLALVVELERIGLIETVAHGEAFDHEALIVTRAAATFHARGVEPRHLRMFKVAADREIGVLGQLVSPLLKKGGESQRRARDELNELVRLGETIRRSILRRSFGSHLD